MMAPAIAPAMAPICEGLLFGRPGGPVSQNHVAELVRHDAGNLALDRCGLNHAAVDVHGPARQRKRIDLAHVDDFEGVSELAMLHLGRHHLHQAPADSIHEGLDAVISKKRQLLLDFLRRLLTKFHILCRRVLVIRRRDDASARPPTRQSPRRNAAAASKAAAVTFSSTLPSGMTTRRSVAGGRPTGSIVYALCDRGVCSTAHRVLVWTGGGRVSTTEQRATVPIADSCTQHGRGSKSRRLHEPIVRARAAHGRRPRCHTRGRDLAGEFTCCTPSPSFC